MTDVTPEMLDAVADYMLEKEKPLAAETIRQAARNLKLKDSTPGQILWEIIVGGRDSNSNAWGRLMEDTREFYESAAVQFIHAMNSVDKQANPIIVTYVNHDGSFNTGAVGTVTLTPVIHLEPVNAAPKNGDRALLPATFNGKYWQSIPGDVICQEGSERSRRLLIDPREA